MFYTNVSVKLKSITSLPYWKGGESMRKMLLVPIFVLALALTISLSAIVFASYNVTSNLANPYNVQPGTNVVITAHTDENFANAKFTWKNQVGVVKLEETIPFTGTPKTAVSDFVVNDGGVWTVSVYSNNGQLIGTFEYTVKVGFNVIPELPIIGTAGASIAMLSGLAYRMRKKNQK